MNKQALAERAAEIMQREDHVSRWLGMQLTAVRPGYVRMLMRVTDNMVNGQKVCHGGLIFALGDELAAEAHEVARAGRGAVYDVRVTNQREELIALFRGKSATVKGTWVE